MAESDEAIAITPKSADNPVIRDLKSGDISQLSYPIYAQRSLTPEAMSSYSPFALEADEYRPSIADQVRVGFFSQDRASQTVVSEVLQLRDMTNVLRQLVEDVGLLKRSLHYAKHVLQADYENKMQERALDLYCRVNDRILDLEKVHEERIQVVRRSYRQQLADAISEISSQHKIYYNKKRKQESAKYTEKLKKAQDDEEAKKKANQQQESLLEMMKMQMREAQERADAQVREALERVPSPSSVATDPEIYELRDEVAKLETTLDEALSELEDKENENRRLTTDLEDLTDQLEQERKRITQLKKELSDALLSAEQDRNRMKAEMERQRLALQNEMETRIQETKKNNRIKKNWSQRLNAPNVLAESQKQAEEMKRLHQESLAKQEALEKQRLAASLKAQTAVTYQSYKPSLLNKESLGDSEKDEMLKKLKSLEKKQRAEILRLQRELDRVNKTWEMKVTILQQTMHALRDESFLRTSLQRQAARLQHAAVVYASNGPAVIPLQSGHRPSKTLRTLPAIRPGRVEGFGRILEGKGFSADNAQDTPFTEDRATPIPVEGDEDEEEDNKSETSESVSVNPQYQDGQSGTPGSGQIHEQSRASGSRASSHVVVLPQVPAAEG
ncbi:uncharacterized protein C10orf67, mitochondrial isoform X2 [Nematostella vectensis]|uniref:uncharacterized protein C10orf67, mitochondrial isoform X2 n=1 Tax=Nematostella vectensis TaxID=45351 RepID=UPI002077304A|nr:uncharacterized protein C10orf67, mitochondrial isoform X2 [Nematostella vectensis]